jgi:hypothetical protein
VTFRYDGKDIETALGQGIDNKSTRQETPVTFAYEGGTPIRFAGAEIQKNIGLAGEFGSQTKDPKMKGYFGDWTSFWTGGPFGPADADDGGMA